MSAALAIVGFYLLLAFAVVVMRGDLTDWPREADRAAALVICLFAVALLLGSWTSSRPIAGPAEDGSSRPRSTWMWWAGLAGLAAFVFLVALPPISTALARPLDVQRASEGRDAPGTAPPPPSPDGSVPIQAAIDPAAGVDAGGAKLPSEEEMAAAERQSEIVDSDSAAPADAAPADAAPADAAPADAPPKGWAAIVAKWRALVDSRPPWFIALIVLLAAAGVGLLWWVWRRFLARPSETSDRAPVQPPWHNDPDAPAYVREFRKLCEHRGCPPRPGDTWRDLLARLPAVPAESPPLEPVAAYHYRVRYEGAAVDAAAEKTFVRLIRAARKVSTFPPATETTTAA